MKTAGRPVILPVASREPTILRIPQMARHGYWHWFNTSCNPMNPADSVRGRKCWTSSEAGLVERESTHPPFGRSA